MSNSKPVAPFVFDVLCYLNRDQLERFSIVCRSLKNIIERYFHTICRTFDLLYIRPGSYALSHNGIQWHPNHDDYSVQKFLGGQGYSNVLYSSVTYYSFAEMLPYLGPNIRIKNIHIYVAASAYNPDHISEMESITYLWSDGRIEIDGYTVNGYGKRIAAEDFLPILNSPTILQCRELKMFNADFSFKDYKVLYSVKGIEIVIMGDSDANHYLDFLEKPGVKPFVAFADSSHRQVNIVLDRLSEDFSSATVPNAFKIVFSQYKTRQPLTEFRETNKISGEKLELKKKGVPIEYQYRFLKDYEYYTLERSRL